MALYAIASLLCAVAPAVPILIGLRLVQDAAGAAGHTAVPMGVVIAALTAAASLAYLTLARGHRPIG